MKITQAESGQEPLPVDTQSSPTTVYVREDIQQIERQDETGHSVMTWGYREKQYTQQEWNELQMSLHIMNLEYELAMLGGGQQ